MRLDDLAAAEKEISSIEQKLLYGERWIDRICYALQQSQQNDKSIISELRNINPGLWALLLAAITCNFLSMAVPNNPLTGFGPYTIYLFSIFGICYYILIDIFLKIKRRFHK